MAASIRFRKEFYSRETLDQALEDWSEVGTFAVADESDYHVVNLDALAPEDDGTENVLTDESGAEVLGEFQNYLLGLEVNNRR